ncbi:20721_t:CDS:2, partial [Cetraspora pellucida]
MESHLALHCNKAPDHIVTFYLYEVAERVEKLALDDDSEDDAFINSNQKKEKRRIITSNYLNYRLLHDGIKNMKIQGRNLELFTKTRWASAFNTTNSIIRIKPVFDKILEENPNIIFNNTVYKLLKDEEEIFFITCHYIAMIFYPIKEIINLLESQTANLADCFVNLVKL